MSRFQEADVLPRPHIVSPADLGGPPAGTFLCTLEDLKQAEAKEFRFGEGWDTKRMIVLARGGGAVAYVNDCPHFHLPLNLDTDKFLDPTGERLFCRSHCGFFRIDNGYSDGGPPEGHWLIPVAIRVEGGRVLAG